MGSAVALGAYSVNQSFHFLCYTPSKTRALLLASKINGTQIDSLENLGDVDAVILACKPQNFSDLKLELKSETLVISLMVGVKSSTIFDRLKTSRIVRTMPNTPTKVNAGVTALMATPAVSMDEREIVSKIFNGIGKTVWLKSDSEIDLFGSIVGAAPAYFSLFLKTLIEAYKEKGIPEAVACEALLKTFIGTGKLFEKDELTPDQMISAVASKGGVTEAGLKSFQEQRLFEITKAATEAAFNRSIELSQS